MCAPALIRRNVYIVAYDIETLDLFIFNYYVIINNMEKYCLGKMSNSSYGCFFFWDGKLPVS